jgi:hypothetical protein
MYILYNVVRIQMYINSASNEASYGELFHFQNWPFMSKTERGIRSGVNIGNFHILIFPAFFPLGLQGTPGNEGIRQGR